MIHNVYAVPVAYIYQPNQVFSATYRVYIGDASGNDIAPSAATTTTWSWKGPATVPTKPAAPSGLTAAVSGSQIVLNWTDNASGETYFQIHRSTDPGFANFTPYNVYTFNLNTWTDNFAVAGVTYYYRVFAGNAKGFSAPVGPVSAAVPGKPAAPSGLTATVTGSKIVLNWTDNASNETYFQIHRSTDPGFATLTPYNVYTVDLNTWTDNYAVAGVTYYYRVIAGNAKGFSAPVGPVPAAVPGKPAAPSGLTATVSGSQIVLNWTDNASNETYFQIHRSTDPGFAALTPYNVYTVDLNTWTDNYAVAGVTYYYRVFAGNAKGFSAPVGPANATVAKP